MTTAHITRNGQIAVPKEVLNELNVRLGDTIAIEIEPSGCLRIYPKTLTASDVAGMVKTKVKSTIEEMNEALAEAFRKGMVIFVPEGSTSDPTRCPAYYDSTFSYLRSLGLPEL